MAAEVMKNAGLNAYTYRGAHRQSLEMAIGSRMMTSLSRLMRLQRPRPLDWYFHWSRSCSANGVIRTYVRVSGASTEGLSRLNVHLNEHYRF
jgi:hypothetical protein